MLAGNALRRLFPQDDLTSSNFKLPMAGTREIAQPLLDTSLTTALTVLSYAIAVKFILDTLVLAIPLVSVFTARLLSFGYPSPRRLRPVFFTAGIISFFYLFYPTLALLLPLIVQLRASIATISLFTLYGADGGYAPETRFYCARYYDTNPFYQYIRVPFRLALSTGGPCIDAEGHGWVLASAKYLLLCDAPTILGRLIRLLLLAGKMLFASASSLSAAIIPSFSITIDKLKAAGMMVSGFTERIEWPSFWISIAFAMCMLVIIKLHHDKGVLSYILEAVDSANDELVGSLLREIDSLKDTLSSPELLSPVEHALHNKVAYLSASLSDALKRLVSSNLSAEQAHTQVKALKAQTAFNIKTINTQQAQINSLRSKVAHSSSLAERLRSQQKINVANRKTIRKLLHTSTRAIRERNEARADAELHTSSLAERLRSQQKTNVSNRKTIKELWRTSTRAIRERDEARADAEMHAQRAEALALRFSEKEASLLHLRIESGMLEGRIEELLAAQANWEVVYEEVENMENLVSGIIDAVVNVSASYSCAPAYAVTSDFPGDTSSYADDPFVNITGETGTINFDDLSELVVPSWASDIDAPAPNAPRTLLATASAPNSPRTPLATAGTRLPASPFDSPIPILTDTPVHWCNPVTPSTQTPAPRRSLIGLSPRTPACVSGGRGKARVTQSTRKILAEKENVLPSLL